MKYFAGLDVSLKEISMCVVDDEGHVVFRRSLPFCPLAVRDAFGSSEPFVTDAAEHTIGGNAWFADIAV